MCHQVNAAEILVEPWQQRASSRWLQLERETVKGLAEHCSQDLELEGRARKLHTSEPDESVRAADSVLRRIRINLTPKYFQKCVPHAGGQCPPPSLHTPYPLPPIKRLEILRREAQ